MKNINHLVEMAGQSHQYMPALLSLFLGLIVIKKRPSVFFNENEVTGDNIPMTLIDSIKG